MAVQNSLLQYFLKYYSEKIYVNTLQECPMNIDLSAVRKKLLDTIVSYSGPKIVLTRICVAVSGLVIHSVPTHWQLPIQVRILP